jgi:hypothetical protein
MAVLGAVFQQHVSIQTFQTAKNQRGAAGRLSPQLIKGKSTDGGRFTQMFFFHRNASAGVTHIFHGRQFFLAYMLWACIGSPAETALGFVPAGIA